MDASKALFEVMDVQGEIKIHIMRQGMSQKFAHELAGEIMHKVLTSPLVKDEYKELYSLMKEEDEN